MSRVRTIIFAGGGSGGHLFPGIAVAKELLRRDRKIRIVFVRSGREIEERVLAATSVESHVIPAPPSTQLRRNPVGFIRDYRRAVREAARWLRDAGADVVVGLGGFASVPLATAAARSEIAVLLLEVNTVAGRATRWLGRRASCVCVAFDECRTARSTRRVVTGNPVRSAVRDLPRRSTPAGGGALLVLGGSQGARAVNRMVLDAAGELAGKLRGFRIVHQTGTVDESFVRARYADLSQDAVVSPFIDDVSRQYAEAKLVISRAGATTLAELSCARAPAILIPFPKSIGQHQLKNARWYETRGAATLVAQTGNGAGGLSEAIGQLISNPSELDRMSRSMWQCARPGAAEDVCDQILALADSVRVPYG